MSLTSGTFLGPYEVLESIGAGGMGEVYRARDPRLERTVAIKVLHPAFAADQDQLRRFELEARSVALLNHPNILQVYDTGLHGGMPYIVMELLEGQSLRERIAGRPLGLRRTLEIAIQVARGLDVAHEKKIIHRDLKPENIFVEPDGRVKILDFGLAKLMTPAADPDQTLQQRGLQGLTQAGALVGTAGYMSPEQVNGWAVDHRSDIFSFGTVLLEMVTGAPPFRRPSMVETLHAILKDEPPEPGPELRVPPALERTIQRCLEKDPRQRFQSSADLIFSLEGASLPASSSVLRRAPIRTLRPWIRPGALALGLLALAAGAFALGRRSGPPVPLGYHRLTYRKGVVQGARFSPDGETFVFGLASGGGPAQLLSGRIDGVGARSLGLPPGTQILSISRSGEMALLFRKEKQGEGTLALAPLSGGAPREVLEHVIAADWDPQGKDLAVIRMDNDRYVLEYPIGHRLYDGPPTTLSALDALRFSPRGDRIAFLEHLGIGNESLSVVDLKGKRQVLVQGGCSSLQWSPNGRSLYFIYSHADDRKDLRAVSLSGRQQVLDTVLGQMHVQDVSRSGRVLVDQYMEQSSLLFQGPSEGGERDLTWLHTSSVADLSPDGKLILLGETKEGLGPGGAYLRRSDGSDAVRLGDGDPLSLSPDGKWALVISLDGKRWLSLFPTGPGTPRVLCRDVRADWAQFVAGGRQVLMGGVGKDGVFRGYLQDVAGGPPRPWPGKLTPEAYCAVAPEGNRVALGPMDGRLSLWSLDGKLITSGERLREGEIPIQWHRDGNAVFLADLSSLPARVVLLDLATGRRKPWKDIGPPDRSGVEEIRNLAITPDGLSLAYSFRRILTSDLYATDPLP